MGTAADYRNLVSGERKGFVAGMLRTGLGLAEFPYRAVVARRNRQFDSGRRQIVSVEVPVISVGNLTLGGTGKTPLVAWLAGRLRQDGIRVAIVSRGYKAAAGTRNDEALELAERLPDVPHVQNRDRVAAARVAIEQFQSQAIVLDDGFQHRRLARDLDIVLLDACEPFGWGHLLPRGYLREPPSGLARADVVVLTRADAVTAARRDEIRREAARYAPRALWLETRHAPQIWRAAGGQSLALGELAGRRVAAVAGIGNPAGFRHTLATAGIEVVAFREFPDHHAYDRADIEELAAWADALDIAAVVCTHKDLVKLKIDRLGRRQLWALLVGLDILAGSEALESRLTAVMRRSGATGRNRPAD